MKVYNFNYHHQVTKQSLLFFVPCFSFLKVSPLLNSQFDIQILEYQKKNNNKFPINIKCLFRKLLNSIIINK